MKKKIVALFLTMALMLSLCAVLAGAQTTLRLNARSATLGVSEACGRVRQR